MLTKMEYFEIVALSPNCREIYIRSLSPMFGDGNSNGSLIFILEGVAQVRRVPLLQVLVFPLEIHRKKSCAVSCTLSEFDFHR